MYGPSCYEAVFQCRRREGTVSRRIEQDRYLIRLAWRTYVGAGHADDKRDAAKPGPLPVSDTCVRTAPFPAMVDNRGELLADSCCHFINSVDVRTWILQTGIWVLIRTAR